MQGETELLDIEQAARFLNVSETSLRRWTNTGRLPCLRIGQRRERRFRRSDLIAFMEAQPGRGRDETSDVASAAPESGECPFREGDHVCGFYGSELGRLKMALAFLGEEQSPGTVTYILGKPEARQPILLHLQRVRPELERDLVDGSLVACEYQQSGKAQLEYFTELFSAAMVNGATSLRLLGDVTAVCGVVSDEELRDYESAYDALIARRFPVVTMCQYDVRVFSGVALLNALKCHPTSLRFPAQRWLA
jgi:excisionase family DNA binding protein